MALFAPFAMNAIMDDRSGKHAPQSENQDKATHKPVPARDAHRKPHVSDEHPRGQSKDKTNLGPHQVAHVPTLRGARVDAIEAVADVLSGTLASTRCGTPSGP
jgi:hypothetical protein